MKVIRTEELPEVLIIEPRVFTDERGFFLETYHLRSYQEGGLPDVFVQDNHSRSNYGILRGLHAQKRCPQGKLVRVIEGEIFDVAVDIRRGSSTFGRWTSVILRDDNFRQFYVPPGFAHGFCVLSPVAQVEYKCTEFYNPSDEISLKWNDPDLNIKWPIDNPVLSTKDQNASTLWGLQASLPHYDEYRK